MVKTRCERLAYETIKVSGQTNTRIDNTIPTTEQQAIFVIF